MMLLLLMFLVITGKSLSFPAQDSPEENDGETSRKVLGSSVVTSVSVILDSGNGTQAYFTDAVGKPVSKPQTGSQVASPINLLNPDRYEFYTFDDNGDLIKRLMTLDEIQGIIANGDGDLAYNSEEQEQQPEKNVDEIVNNIQNVLKEEMETHKPSDNKPILDTPDVSSTWSMILPAIFGNSGEDIKPARPNAVMTPDTIVLEESTMRNKVELLKTTTETNKEATTVTRDLIKISTTTEQLPITTTNIQNVEPSTNTNLKTTQEPQHVTINNFASSIDDLQTMAAEIITTTSEPVTQTESVTTIKPGIKEIENTELKSASGMEATELSETTTTAKMTDTPLISVTILTHEPSKVTNQQNKPSAPKLPNLQEVTTASTIVSIKPLPSLSTTTVTTRKPEISTMQTKSPVTSANTENYKNMEKIASSETTQPNHSKETETTITSNKLIEATSSLPVSLTEKDTLLREDTLLHTTEKVLDATTTQPSVTELPKTDQVKFETTTTIQNLPNNDLKQASSNNFNASILESAKNATKDEKPEIVYEEIKYTSTTENAANNSKQDAQKIEISEILNQLLLTTTNIYEINTELGVTTEEIDSKTTTNIPELETSSESATIIPTTTTKEEITTLREESPTILPQVNETTLNEVKTTSNDDSLTTETIISSIEQLILQASSQPEDILNGPSNSANIQNVLENSNAKPMNVLQEETATVASQLLNNENAVVKDSIGESLSSLISQITNSESTTIESDILTTPSNEENVKVSTTINANNLTKTQSNVIATISYKSETENEPTPESIIKKENDLTQKTNESVVLIEDKVEDGKKNKKDNEMEVNLQNSNISNPLVISENIITTTITIPVTDNYQEIKLTPVESNLNQLLDNRASTSESNQNISDTTQKESEEIQSTQTPTTQEIKETTSKSILDSITTSQFTYLPETTSENFEITTEINKIEQSTTSENKLSSIADVSTTIKQEESKFSFTQVPSKTENQNSTWMLVPTVGSLKETTFKPTESTTPYINIDPPKPVNLINQPIQGYGLEDSTSSLDADVYRFVELCNELAFGFWKSVTNGISTARSVIVSPFAATSLLAMVFLGARGATSGEMNEILRLDDMVTFNPHLIFKNVSESIESSEKHDGIAVSAIVRELYSDRSKGKLLGFYKERAKQFYDGHVEEASFKEMGDVVRRRTNLIVKRQSAGKIQEYIKDTPIVLRPPLAGVSASIFQTDCSGASTDGRDGELYFVVLPTIRQRRLIPVPAAVWRSNFLAGYDPTLDATAVSIGMKDQIISTIYVIPGQQGIAAPGDGLNRLEKRLVDSAFKTGAWSRLLRTLIPRPGLEVQIPRFSHRSVINATSGLQRMGLKDLFSSEKADLRGLNGVANELYLSDILQVNNFATCAEVPVGDAHHSEIYPATARRSFRKSRKLDLYYVDEDEPRDYQRAFHDPLHDPTYLSIPLPLRPRQARLPETPRLRFDRPFLYFVRHNPTGLILHMGRFNPRLLP